MTKIPPAPFMHRTRDANGKAVPGSDTTQPSTYPHGRAKKDIGPRYAARDNHGQFKVRRPDVVVVKDPRLPPVKDNIEMLVEMKFEQDSGSKANVNDQVEDYETIAGKGKVFVFTGKEKPCLCKEVRKKRERARKKMGDAWDKTKEIALIEAATLVLKLILKKGGKYKPGPTPSPAR